MLNKINIQHIIEITQAAGASIMEIYAQDFDPTIEKKADNSPLTIADKAANAVIVAGLQKYYPEIPIISEENKLTDYKERKDWEYCWLVDPLDGTKEFIKKNGEFTVNIALIHKDKSVLGVVFVPAKNETYYAIQNKGSFKINSDGEVNSIRTKNINANEPVIIFASRSHLNEDTSNYIEQQRQKYGQVEITSAGSSLKFCLVAEGKAHLYPRFAPTMEWDTGAAHIIATEAGAKITNPKTGGELQYNKENLLNPYFLVEA